MASLKRDTWGNWIVKFRTGGRGTPPVREKLGQMNGQWRDVLLLERRSPAVGVS